ncbi:uncharacterized protein LOC120784446 isoform X2 [Xiphias gladius]|uniref:uncharacterized protein LOC120784446 isoform X2 n=1 Tax=Xiphias gladius TaxID=8245 RepID=UPI001A98A0CD|nr:uncharacterized protein LOC120784446 isoform X2 [Xiphias gladius]
MGNSTGKVPAEKKMVKKLLAKTLDKLSSEELHAFLSLLDLERDFPFIWRRQLRVSNTQEVAELMVKTCGQECLDITKKVLKMMKRTDLVQRLSDMSTEIEDQHSWDEQQCTLIQKEETMASVIELLLETLADLSDREIKKFNLRLKRQTQGHKPHSDVPLKVLEVGGVRGTVFFMVQTFGQQSVERAKEILKKMKRNDLVQRLSDSSSGPTKKHPVDELLSVPMHKMGTMPAVKELLLESLNNLSHSELEKFRWILQLTYFQKGYPQIERGQLLLAAKANQLLDLMEERHGPQSLKVTMEVFRDMNRTDLVQGLSETSSGLKALGASAEVFGVNTTEGEKRSVYKCCSALVQEEKTMVSVIELLLETLADLSDREIEDFKILLLKRIRRQKPHLDIPWWLLNIAGVKDTVFLTVQTFSQQSEEVTMEILEEMQRTDLVQRLSDSSSGLTKKHSVDEHRFGLIQKVATMAAVKRLLLKTLDNLGKGEFEKFLKWIVPNIGQEDISRMLNKSADRENTVDLMVENHGRQCVEVIREGLKDLKTIDLVQKFSETSPGPKEKRLSLQLQKEEAMNVKEELLEALEDLDSSELELFNWLLISGSIRATETKRGLPRIQKHGMETPQRANIVEWMLQTYGENSPEVTMDILRTMKGRDVVQRLSETSSGSKGPSRRLELEGCGSTMKSSDWTKLDPEVISTDADESPTYSLQSEAGNFECSVSNLHWLCEEKVSFKYKFISWEGHVERMESIQYMPAGPLMDITVIAGKLDIVYLPHWICIDDNPTILDKFAVLHIDDCGDVVEKVSEVTPSHVKLPEPSFSPRAVLMKAGFPVKINCKVLIYKTNTAFLTLHVYLIPCDPGLQQTMDKRALSYGYKIIHKPHPEKSLKMQERFILKAELDGAEICPEMLKLRYESREPNFFEMFVENPCRNFKLTLIQRDQFQPVWTCVIRKEEYQSTGHTQGGHFVDEHQCDLIDRVSNIGPILDNLLTDGVIQREEYDQIRAIPTTQERMRKLYAGPLKAGGHESKDIFYKILEEKEPCLVADLRRKES